MSVIRRRASGDASALPSELHPLLRRLYAARNVSASEELQLALDRLIPVRQLGGIYAELWRRQSGGFLAPEEQAEAAE